MITAIRYAVAVAGGAALGFAVLAAGLLLAAGAALETVSTFAGLLLAGAR